MCIQQLRNAFWKLGVQQAPNLPRLVWQRDSDSFRKFHDWKISQIEDHWFWAGHIGYSTSSNTPVKWQVLICVKTNPKWKSIKWHQIARRVNWEIRYRLIWSLPKWSGICSNFSSNVQDVASFILDHQFSVQIWF